MLGKLFKYEMKSTARIFLPFFAAVIGLSLINKITFSIFSKADYFNIPQFILIATYIFMLIATFVLTIIVTVQRFYKNLLGQEGYLMFTLPVTASSHILSKAFAAIIWILSTILITLLSIFIIMPEYSWIQEITQTWDLASAEFLKMAGTNLNLFIFEIIISAFISVIAFTLMVYTSISIGQLSNSHKLLASFGAFLGIYVVEQVINGIFVSILSMRFELRPFEQAESVLPNGWLQTIILGAILIQVLITIVYYFVTRYILSKHLNLE